MSDELSTQTAVKDLPDEILEQLLFSELVANQEFASRIIPIFKEDWIGDNELRPMSKLIMKWRERFDTAVTKDLIQALLTKYVQNHPGCGINVTLCVQKFIRVTNLDLGGLEESVRIKTINEFIKKNVLKEAIMKGAKLLSTGNLSGVVAGCINMLEEAERVALDPADTGLTYNTTAFEANSENGKIMEAHYNELADPAAKISTGWPTVDMHTCGGFLKKGKSLYIVMGQAGLGKTVALTNLGYNFLCQGLKVVVFTLEMSNNMYGRRFDALMSDVDLDDLGPLVNTVKDRIRNFFMMHPTAELIIKEFPPRTANTNTFTAFINNLQKDRGKDWKPDVILVDYLNLVSCTSSIGEDNMYQEGIRVSEQLRELSYKFEAPVITAVQTNTEGMDTTELGMKNISQSRGIAHTADFIMAIYADDNGDIKGKIIKNRLGALPVGQSIGFRRDSGTLRMNDLQQEYQDTTTTSRSVDDLPSDLVGQKTPNALDGLTDYLGIKDL